ncbi:MAG: hypothetical protein ABGY96_06405 [bacterium]|nr:hypothetical protein [Gammaproteobacteria bacterium]HIL97827.1 hypothetical protein [Pseudomonadales bacterium]
MDTRETLKCLGKLEIDGVNGFSVVQALGEQEPEKTLSPQYQSLVELLDICCSEFVRKAEFPDDVA